MEGNPRTRVTALGGRKRFEIAKCALFFSIICRATCVVAVLLQLHIGWESKQNLYPWVFLLRLSQCHCTCIKKKDMALRGESIKKFSIGVNLAE